MLLSEGMARDARERADYNKERVGGFGGFSVKLLSLRLFFGQSGAFVGFSVHAPLAAGAHRWSMCRCARPAMHDFA
jgi:hypothetical protein